MRIHNSIFTTTWAFLFVWLPAPLAAEKGARDVFVPGELVVQRAMSAKEEAIENLLRAHGLRKAQTIDGLNVHILKVPEPAIESVKRALFRTGLFTFIERNGLARGSALPNDPRYPSQWHLAKIAAPTAWDATVGAATVPLAIVDSGVDAAHPDLASKLLPGWSFLLNSNNTADVLGHGTATAGTAAAVSNNATGVAGVAWQNPILPIAVLDANNYASYSNLANGIKYAADRGARVINASIGGASPSSLLQAAVDYAWGKGAIVVASAMNNSSSTPYYPAACDKAVSVAATDSNDNRASFSNFGPTIDLSAPGTSILTTSRGAGYSYWSGTSFSAPLVAGVAALAISLRPTLTPGEITALLTQNADELGAPGFDAYFGWGRLNAARVMDAVRQLGAPDSSPPTISIVSPAAGATVSGTISIGGKAADNQSVSSIMLLVDGLSAGAAEGAGTFSIPWNTLSVANGQRTLTVEACDGSFNCRQASVVVNVNNAPGSADVQPPTVQITNPQDGSAVRKNVNITVDAKDNAGLSQVVIYIDGVQRYSGTSAPLKYTWNTSKASAGEHVIEAKAWDFAGNSAAAPPVRVRN
jgi:hypothetical protein